ncbi:MAG: serine hydrolase domain-containing protein [Myxococcota bacterium]
MAPPVNRKILIGAVALLGLSACTGASKSATSKGRVNALASGSSIPRVTAQRAKSLDNGFVALLEKHEVQTAGVAVIKNGRLQWTGYYGEQSAGVPASARTQFDIASVTKTVSAETVLRLASEGAPDLDEPMATHWRDQDLVDEPLAEALTPRTALSHSTGLPNGRFLADDGSGYDPSLPLRIGFQPGTSFRYSGEGLEYVARFVQAKLGADFEQLVKDEVFEPAGMSGVSFSRREANFPNIVHAVDAQGEFPGHYCRPGGFMCRAEGFWSAADDMRVTVPDHAKFLIGAMNGEGLSPKVLAARNTVQIEKWNEPDSILVRCDEVSATQCPKKQGYGLGWEVADYGDHQLLAHGGSDFSEVAITYFYTDTKDGIIILLNAPNASATAMMADAIELVHPGSPIAPHYRFWNRQQS